MAKVAPIDYSSHGVYNLAAMERKIILASEIMFTGKRVILACDLKCDKAFGRDARPRVELSGTDEDDWEYMADDELPTAPRITGATEGGFDKPRSVSQLHNKWCARQCERSAISEPGEQIIIKDFSKRVRN